MIGGSDFSILIDSGASANYVHPKLLHYAKKMQPIQNQAVETANGEQTSIDKIVTLEMYLGQNHEYKDTIHAFVFESKFDIILGKAWLKAVQPKPDWFADTWEIIHQNKLDKTILYPKLVKTKSTFKNSQSMQNQSVPTEMHDPQMSNSISSDGKNNDMGDSLLPPTIQTQDYLISTNQLSRLFKKNQVKECFVINILNKSCDMSYTHQTSLWLSPQ